MKAFHIGVDSYGLSPLNLAPMELLEWAKNNRAEGVQFSGLSPEESQKIDEAYLKDLAQYAASSSLYLEWGGGQHIPFDMDTWERKEIFEINRKAAQEAVILGTHVIRSCSGGLMRWSADSPSTEVLLREMADSLRSQRQMLKDHNVILAIETHFEFTTHELLRLLEECNAEPGDYLGICLDTMNLLTMLEDPVLATERILPWVVSTHIKDGGILLDSDGLVTFPVEIGKGIVNLPEIVKRIASIKNEVHLTIEDHGGSFALPIHDPLFLSKFPDLTLQEFGSLIQMAYQATEADQAGKLAITEREKWPEICESRLKQDIQSLRKLLKINL
ncbi:MAG: sugar phosphate isomerase/epimerase [Candidatus Aminicenantes bacterium]|nr:MAG: sugar phosphate isomerase/epimerase [Candidatus Aminicenantes bacterium]